MYLIGLASISTVIVLVLPLVVFDPQTDHCIIASLGYLINSPQVSIRYSPGTISPRSQSS
jgi:EamA domain-containing membrane protein RarD